MIACWLLRGRPAPSKRSWKRNSWLLRWNTSCESTWTWFNSTTTSKIESGLITSSKIYYWDRIILNYLEKIPPKNKIFTPLSKMPSWTSLASGRSCSTTLLSRPSSARETLTSKKICSASCGLISKKKRKVRKSRHWGKRHLTTKSRAVGRNSSRKESKIWYKLV